MPDPIMSRPEPLVSQAEEPEVIEIEPVVIVGSTISANQAKLNAAVSAPITAREAGMMALSCASEIDAVAILALSVAPANPVIGALGAFKVGLDYSMCMGQAQSDLVDQRAAAACREMAGRPIKTLDGVIECEVQRSTP